MKDVLFCVVLVLALFFCGGGLREAQTRKPPAKGADGMEPIAVTVRRTENGGYTLQAPHREVETFGNEAALFERLRDFPGARILLVLADPTGTKLFSSLADGQELAVTFE